MIDIISLLFLVWIHFISDFILQSDKVAKKKSKEFNWLAYHSFVYALPFLLVGPSYSLINGLLHFFVDGVTSRINSELYSKGKIHWFFVGIGFDQAIHITMLVLTFILIYGG